MLYDFTDDFLKAVSSLESDGRLLEIQAWFKDFAEMEKNEILHHSPDPADQNFDARFQFRRGVASFADVLAEVFSNAKQLLDQRLVEQEEQRKLDLKIKAYNQGN